MIRSLIRWTLAPLLLAAAALGLPREAMSQDYPSRPVKIIVPFPAGGPADAMARVLSDGLRGELNNQSVVVENLPGASGVIGSKNVAMAKPDGYTLLLTSASTHAIAPAMSKVLPYDPVRDFAPVSLLASAVFVVVVHPSVPAKTLAELVAVAKAKPTALNYPSSGNGSLIHLAGLLFQSLSGTQLTHVPYKGAQPAMVDLVAGQLQLQFAEVGGILPFVKSGKVRPLAVMSPHRIATMPDVPTVAEAGMPGLDVPGWAALFAPAGTPQPVVDLLTRSARAAITRPEARERLAALGIEPQGTDAQTLKTKLAADYKRMGELIRKANLSLE